MVQNCYRSQKAKFYDDIKKLVLDNPFKLN